MRYLQQKHNVSTRVLKIALRYNYDLSTDQRMILEAAEQKNNAILKKYLSDLLQQHFGEHGIEKFQSCMREYRTIAKSHQSAKIPPLFVAKIGKDTATLLTKVLEIGIMPLAILYFNIDEWNINLHISAFGGLTTLSGKMVIAYDLMKAVGLYKK